MHSSAYPKNVHQPWPLLYSNSAKPSTCEEPAVVKGSGIQCTPIDAHAPSHRVHLVATNATMLNLTQPFNRTRSKSYDDSLLPISAPTAASSSPYKSAGIAFAFVLLLSGAAVFARASLGLSLIHI